MCAREQSAAVGASSRLTSRPSPFTLLHLSPHEARKAHCNHIRNTPTEDGLTSLHIHYSPMLQNYDNTSQYERRWRRCPTPNQGRNHLVPSQAPAFPSRADQVITSFPFPPYSMYALLDVVADMVNQQLATFLPAHLLGSFACAYPSLVTLSLLSLSFPFLTCLRFPAKPSQICYQIRGKESPPLSQSFTSCGYPCFVFFSPDP